MNSPLFRLALLGLCLAGASFVGAAEPPAGFSRRILLEQDLATAGRHGAIAVIDFAAGASSPRHTHPGEEFLFILEGHVSVAVDGQPTRELHAGDALIIPAGAAHIARNLGSGPAKIVSTYFLETGKPLASPAK